MGDPLGNWLRRHQNPTSFWLHMVGIPASFVVAPLLACAGWWVLAGLSFTAGYAVQMLGHQIEGNRSGEEMLLRRLARAVTRRRG